jgi:hypothetical protein
MRSCPFCAEDVQDAAIVCKHCQHVLGSSARTTPPPIPRPPAVGRGVKRFALISLAAIAALSVLSLAMNQTDRPRATAAVERASAPAPARERSGLTMANYLRISEGMSYQEVVAIIGEPGKEMSSSNVAGYHTVMYGWNAWTGAGMNAMFQNGKLVTKAQFGLR